MSQDLDLDIASAITRAASKQTYYTIRFLADRHHVEDAYRAYAYFRWVDDVLDADSRAERGSNDERAERDRFLNRQKSLLDRCLRGAKPGQVSTQEAMLVALTQGSGRDASGLRDYLRNMMLVMEFDVGRRGRLISQAELTEYTHWLAVAVTEALHHFIGNGSFAPHDETRYLAVSAAHIMHMLRDTYDDLRLGYYNVPREVLQANHIGPGDVHSGAYRAWVERRVQLARTYFDAGKSYFSRVQSLRHRLAGLAYVARFEWLMETLEREGFRLRPRYGRQRTLAAGFRTSKLVLSSLIASRSRGVPAPPVTPARQGHA